MPFTLRSDTERRVVIVTVTGAVDMALTGAMVAEARAAAGPLGFNLLYDFRGATPSDIQHTDMFWFPRRTPALAAPASRRVRVAALHMPPQRELMQFWETTFSNVGLQAKAFEDEAAAFAWLAA